MERISEFCNENKTQIIFVGGVTILCLGMYKNLFSKKLLSTTENEKKNEGELQVVDGDVLNYGLPHVKPGYDAVYFSGMPDSIGSIFSFKFLRQVYDVVFRIILRLEYKNVNFLNARARNLEFDECGFCIVEYEETFDPKDWHLKENQEKFQKDMEAIILEKFPGATMNAWYSTLFRGGEGQNPAAVDGPHLDNHPDFERMLEFVADDDSKYAEDLTPEKKNALLNAKDRKMIGIWKPICMKNPILDFPLAFMDKSTFRPMEDSVEFRQQMTHIDQGEVRPFKNLGAHIRYNEDQKWYYYPEMKNNEVLIFIHSSKGDNRRCCPHTSFTHPSAPKDKKTFQTRQSMETRCMLVWPSAEETN